MKKKLRIAWHLLWWVALVSALTWDYTDKKADGHDQLVLGVHVYAHRPLDALWIIIGGLGFWFGMWVLKRNRI